MRLRYTNEQKLALAGLVLAIVFLLAVILLGCQVPLRSLA